MKDESKNYFKLNSPMDFLWFSLPQKKNQATEVKSFFLWPLSRFIAPRFFCTAYFNFEGKYNFLKVQNFMLRFFN